MTNKIVIIVIVLILVVAGGLYYSKNIGNNPAITTESPTPTPSPTVSQFPITSSTTTPSATNTPVSTVSPTLLPTTTSKPTVTPTPTTTPKTHAVTIQSFAFVQSSITIKKGDIVVWTNKDSAPHNVIGDGGLASATISTNATYSFTFNATGTFSYHCSFHPSMTGRVVVTE